MSVKEISASLNLSFVLLGVEDLFRSKHFYVDLGWIVTQDYSGFVALTHRESSTSLGLYPRNDAAKDAGVSSEGSGFRAVTLQAIVPTKNDVDAIIARASVAGGSVVKEPSVQAWGYFGYFSDPDRNLWKVASS